MENDRLGGRMKKGEYGKQLTINAAAMSEFSFNATLKTALTSRIRMDIKDISNSRKPENG